jgi:hypothetical protein
MNSRLDSVIVEANDVVMSKLMSLPLSSASAITIDKCTVYKSHLDQLRSLRSIGKLFTTQRSKQFNYVSGLLQVFRRSRFSNRTQQGLLIANY